MDAKTAAKKAVFFFCAAYGGLWTIFEVLNYFGFKPLENTGLNGQLVFVSISFNISLAYMVFILVIHNSGRDNNENLIVKQVKEVGINSFFSSRKDYARYRPNTPTIDGYVSTAKTSLVMVSINLMTGLPFDGLCNTIRSMLEDPKSNITVTISLLNFSKRELMLAVAPVLNETSKELCNKIKITLQKLLEMKNGLSQDSKARFELRVHNSLPFGSAILIDHNSNDGRIQIETKPYKAPFSESIAFEVVSSGSSCLYASLGKSYGELLKDGHAVDELTIGIQNKSTRKSRG